MAGSLYILPISIFIILPATFAVSYILSAVLGHVYPYFPNISETGTLPPESCFFGLMLNISAAMISFAIYVRHKQLSEFYKIKNFNKLRHRADLLSLFIGNIACFGLILAANFQQTNVRIVHDIGIFLCFWCGIIYIWMQCLASAWMIPEINSIKMVTFRSLLAVLGVIMVVLRESSETISNIHYPRNKAGINITVKWNPSEPGWDWHVVSSVSEWIILVIISFFFLSYTQDFHIITLYAPEITMKDDPQDLPKTPVPLRSYKRYGFLYQ